MTPTVDPVVGRLGVLMVSTSYPADLRDWRGLFMRHLADALGRRQDLHLRLWAPPGETHPDIEVDVIRDERAWLSGLMAAGGIAHRYRSAGARGLLEVYRLLRYLRRLYRRNESIDVLHVNWMQNTLPLPRGGRPLLVTALGTDLQLLKLPFMKTMLRHTFKHRRTMICPNADWMVAPLQRAFGDVAEVEFVPFGIDPRWYSVDRSVRRTPHRWLAVTRLTRAKLGRLFSECAPLFANGGRELHLIGPMQEPLDLPSWVSYHGPIGPDDLCSTWFPQATGLITLSEHAEGRPQVMLEAMASGLPIIASDIPAHSSFLANGETGFLIDGNRSVSNALTQLEQPAINDRIGRSAREWAAREVGTWDDCAERYVQHYLKLVVAP